MSHRSTQRRDYHLGIDRRRIEQPREALPRLPARLPAHYCKRLKGEHVFELADVRIGTYYHLLKDGKRMKTVWRHKEYRCAGCGKKRLDYEHYAAEKELSA